MIVLSIQQSRSMIAALLLLASLACQLQGQNRPGAKPKSPEEMLEALASRNTAPKLVMLRIDTIALFPKDYDWREQQRVHAAIQEFYKAFTTERHWEAAVRYSNDSRYSLTRIDNADWAINWSVSSFCRDYAKRNLHAAYGQHLPRTSDGRPIYLDIDIDPNLKAWREKRKDKNLYELQIEAAEIACKQLARRKGISKNTKNRAISQIEKEIEKLRTARKPLLFPPPFREMGYYNAEIAQRDRDRYEAERNAKRGKK